MKFEEKDDSKEEGSFEENCKCSEDKRCLNSYVSIDKLDDLFNKERYFDTKWEDNCKNDVEEEKHEVFPVTKAYTVCYPRAMVVHVQHASLASWTMVASTLIYEYLYGLKLWHNRQ